MQRVLPARTEQLDPASQGMDGWDNDAILSALWEGQVRAIDSVKTAIPQISDAATAIVATITQNTITQNTIIQNTITQSKGRLIYTGAGSSGLLAMQDGMEMTPTFNWPASKLVFLMAGGDQARLQPTGPGEDDAQAAEDDLANIALSKDDVIIAVAASGSTPYSVRVLELALESGAVTIGIANNADTPVLNLARYPILLDSGPEVIAGSTRLGAGTAQKAALGMLSSLVMTKLGHVVDGWMVSMVADNNKLKERAARMVESITQCTNQAAISALEESAGDVKLAVMLVGGHTIEQATEKLKTTNGHLRAALES